mmetsp:Transcript_16086/g.38185  ORF Transcript_16086/g.38185 Transcript_16086/m.38185 type:complete len:340 (-) Transcript_16086:172-1191(-)
MVSVDSSARAAGPDAVAIGRKRNVVKMRRVQAIGNGQPIIGNGPRTLSGKRPTAAALRLEREYLDWSAVPPSRDDVVQDYDAFMAERRQTAEREREQKRKEARHARGLLRKPAGQGARYGHPGPRTGYAPQPRGGREINPNSKRQLGFAAQRQRAADRVVAGQQRRAQRKGAVERAKEEKAIAEVELGQDACLHAQNNMRNLLDRLQEHLGHYRPADHHAAEYHFWQAVATGRFVSTRHERGGAASVAERYASQARTLWAAAKAAVAADQAAAFAARTSAIEQPLLATCQETDVAKQHALRAEAVTLAAEAAARIAYCRLPRIAIKKMTDADFEMHTNF